MLVRRVVLCIASCAIAGPFGVLHAQQPTDARAGYDATVRKFQQYFKRGDANAAGALYTDDVLIVEEDGTRTKSRAAAVRALHDMFGGMTVKDFTVRTAEFHSEAINVRAFIVVNWRWRSIYDIATSECRRCVQTMT